MAATIGVSFCTDVTAFTELLGVLLAENQPVFLPIAEALLDTVFGLVVHLITVGGLFDEIC